MSAVGFVGVGTVFLANADASAFSLAVPLLHRAFHEASIGSLGLVQSAYGLGFALTILPAGMLADRHGPRAPLLAGLGLFASASMLGAVAPSPSWVDAARVLSGAGIAAAVPGALTLLLTGADEVARRRRAGQWGAAGAVAAGCGPLFGGLVGQAVGWRGLFLLTAVPAILLLLAAHRLAT